MIQLVRPAEPAKLSQKRRTWTARWQKILQENSKLPWATKAAGEVLRTPLLAFSRGKCAFCEGVLGLTSIDEIEHYHAKTVQPLRAFEWENLFPACGFCNRSKSNIDHGGHILKPDVDNPELLLWLDPGTGQLQPHPAIDLESARRVQETIDGYKLQRGALCVKRIEMMNFINRWLSRNGGLQEMSPECVEEWQLIVNPLTEWKFVIRWTLTDKGRADLAEIDRQGFLHHV